MSALLFFAMCHPDHCIAFLKKTLESEDSLEKRKSLHQSSGGLQVCTAHFTLECSEKNLFTRPKDIFFPVYFVQELMKTGTILMIVGSSS